MSTATNSEQLIAELYTIGGKAEIVEDTIVMMSPSGDMHGRAAGAIYVSLRKHEKEAGGRAYPDNVGFLVNLPNRKSFSPDVAFHTGPHTGMKFLDQAPDFAVEIRSENDYGPSAEMQIAAKRADYFEAGTKVVWDVDLLSEDVVRVYRAEQPEQTTVYRKGEQAEAEPAVLGWKVAVDSLFE